MNLCFALLLVMASAETNFKAKDSEFPYQVSLGLTLKSSHEFVCGGSIISPTFIITAAQCMQRPDFDPPVENFTVYLGSIQRLKGIERTVRCIIVHNDWDMEKSLCHNIALVQIDGIQYSRKIENIALTDMSSDTDFEGSAAVSLGWENNTSAVLQYASLLVMSNVECALAISPVESVIEDTQICASAPSGPTTCLGDAGGPLVHEESNTLIGIILPEPGELNENCNVCGVIVFTRITSYREWIRNYTGI